MKESWLSLIIILICIAVIVLCAFNALTYGKIANEKKTVGDVTPGGARALMVINIILCVVFFIPVIVYGRRFYYSALKGRVFSWLNLIIILGIIASIILCAFNAATYGKIANENKTVGDVTPGGARALMVINILLCIIFLVPLFYYSYKMYSYEDAPVPINLATERELGMKRASPQRASPRRISQERAIVAEEESIVAFEKARIAQEKSVIAKQKEMIAVQTGDPRDMRAAARAAADAEEAMEETRMDFEETEIMEELNSIEQERKLTGQDKIMDFLRLNIKNIDDSDAVYDTVCNPFNPLRSRKCDL